MLDATLRKVIDPITNGIGKKLAQHGLTSNQVTLTGVFFAIFGTICILLGWLKLALLCLILNRLCDGLDGAVARATQKTVFGGVFDIVSDYVFYGFYPLAFILYDPLHAYAYGFLLAAFLLTASSFLAYAIIAAKRGITTEVRGKKSFYFVGGLAEGTETILTFILMLLFPNQAYIIALIFGSICILTAIIRVFRAKEIFID